MHFLYNFLLNSAEKALPLSTLFNDKMKLFINGRKEVFDVLKQHISAEDKTIWFHAASLGEYEQALPVILEVKQIFPKHKIVLSFFSPSGYEVKKDSAVADVVVYLPLDTSKNARKFLDLVHPDWVLFIKYEFWPNFLKELKNRNIRTLLISGAFREDQAFFKSYGKWMRKYLEAFEYFFLQNSRSKELLSRLGYDNAAVSGDTRFDRVSKQLEQENRLEFIEEFKNDELCVVAGSSWPEDEALLVKYINEGPKNVKYIIAPHTLKPARIEALKEQIEKSVMLFSEKEGKQLNDYRVLIVDTIGLLGRIYSYADIAFVGGAVGNTGLHNILEPATFGVPVITGTNITRFPEAVALRTQKGLFSVSSYEPLKELLDRLLNDETFRRKTGKISSEFISNNTGATGMITRYLRENSRL
ncbi:MAG: glycosyltransferase N-terminal domain-containing protein [Salinimicrobium sp.]